MFAGWGSCVQACGRGIAEIVGCRDDARVMDVMGCGFVSAAHDRFGIELETGEDRCGDSLESWIPFGWFRGRGFVAVEGDR